MESYNSIQINGTRYSSAPEKVTFALLKYLNEEGVIALFKAYNEEYYRPIYESDNFDPDTLCVTPLAEDTFIPLEMVFEFLSENELHGIKMYIKY